MPLPPNRGLDQIRSADERYLATLDTVTEDGLKAPSLLPGWSRAHVVAHLARNAEGLARAAAGLREGAPAPIYHSQDSRNADIEADTGLPRDELVARSHRLHREVLDVFASLSDEHWRGQVRRLPDTEPIPAANLVAMRHREVEIHHADLGLSYSAADWPADFTCVLIDQVCHDRARGPACTLVATDVDAGPWRVGDGDGPEVSGPSWALAWWLVGRGSGDGLNSSDDELPDLGRWR